MSTTATTTTATTTPSSTSSTPTTPTTPTMFLPPTAQTPRLSIPFALRLPILTGTSILLGGALGSMVGGHRASLIFRAENSHRQPTSTKGWYFYHKTKNYHVAYGAVVAGVKHAVRVGAWVAMFVIFEDAVDRLRGRVDALSTVCAGLGGAGVFSLWHGLGYGFAVRTAKKGFVIGAGFGLAQDAIRCLKGQHGGVFEYMGIGAGRREARAADEAAMATRH